MAHEPRRLAHVMSEIRRSRPHSATAPNQEPKPTAKGWLFMRDLMQETREREDGTWYLSEDAREAAKAAETKGADQTPTDTPGDP